MSSVTSQSTAIKSSAISLCRLESKGAMSIGETIDRYFKHGRNKGNEASVFGGSVKSLTPGAILSSMIDPC